MATEHSLDRLSLPQRQAINDICLEYERAWKEGRRPRIQDFARRMDGDAGTLLLVELFAQDLDLRIADGRLVSRDEYLDGFPDAAEAVEAAFALIASRGDSGFLDDVTVARSDERDEPRQGMEINAGSDRHRRFAEIVARTMQDVQKGGHYEFEQLAGEYPEHVEELRLLHPSMQLLADLSSGESGHEIGSGVTGTLGDYRLGREIGRGGMGIVYEASQISLAKRVAVKVLPFASVLDSRRLQRFLNEARAAAQLQHENIVPVHAVGCDRGVHYYAMRLIEGKNLAEVVRDLRNLTMRSEEKRPSTAHADKDDTLTHDGHAPSASDGGGTPAATYDETSNQILAQLSTRRSATDPEYFRGLAGLGIQAANALQHAHDMGVVHRDIKPSNLMLDIEGQLWITDFGLAQVQDATGVTVTGDFVGTLRYMSPEQALAKRVVVDHRTDIYSLGVTLYELVTTRRAFDGQTRAEVLRKIAFAAPTPPRKINRHIPAELETIILKALARNPDDRYQSARELANDLTALRNHRPIRARPPSVTQRVEKWMRRNPAYAKAIGLATILIVLISTFAALAGWGGFALEQRRRTRLQQALLRSEGSRLTAHSRLQLEHDPGLALLLAIEGARRYPSLAANNALLSALNASHEFRTLKGHATFVGQARYSPNGQFIVSTAGHPGTIQGVQPACVWDAQTGQLLRKLDDQTWITSAVISPDGVRVLTTTNPYPPWHTRHHGDDKRGDRPPCVWDALTGRKVLTLTGARLPEAHEASFSPDGMRLVTPAAGNKAAIWDTLSGKVLQSLDGHQAPVLLAAFSPDGKSVTTVSRDQTIRVWLAETGTQMSEISWPPETEDPPWSIRFSPDSRWLLTSFLGWGPQVWDIETARRVNPARWAAQHAIFSSDGNRTIAYHIGGKTAQVNDIVSGKRVALLEGHLDTINAIALSPDGQTVATASTDQTVRLWDVDTGTPLATLRGHTRGVQGVHFSPDGRQLVSASSDQTVRIWNVKSVSEALSLTNDGAVAPNSRAAYGPRGRQVLVLTNATPRCILWDLATGDQTAEFAGSCELPPMRPSVRVSAWGHTARVWEPGSGKQRAVFTANNLKFRHARLSENGEVAIVVGDQGPSYLWYWKTDRRMVLRAEQSEVYASAVSPDGKRAATGSTDGRVLIWNTRDGAQVAELLHRGSVWQTRFSSDGRQLLTVTDRNTAHVWNLDTAQEIVTMSIPGMSMNEVRWNADESRVVTYHTYRNDAIGLWDAANGKLLNKVTDIKGRVQAVFEPGGERLAIASMTAGLVLWDYVDDTQEFLSTLPFSSAAFSSDGKRLAGATSVLRPDLAKNEQERQQDSQLNSPTLFVWDVQTRQVQQTISLAGSDTHMLQILDDDERLLASVKSYGATIFDSQTGQENVRIAGHAAPIACAEFSSDGKQLLTASWDGTASLWDAQTGERIHALEGHQQAVLHAVLTPDSVITASGDGTCIVWNRRTGKRSATLEGHTDEVGFVAISQDRRRVLTLARDHTMRLWTLEGEELDRKELADRVFLRAQFQPHGNGLLVIPGLPEPERYQVDKNVEQPGYNVRIYRDLQGDRFGDEFIALAHLSMPVAGSFSPDGTRVITVDLQGDAFLWNAATGGKLRSLHRDDQQIKMAVFDPTGKRLLTSNGSELALRDSQTGAVLMTLSEQYPLLTGPFSRASAPQLFQPFSPGGKWLVTVGLQSHVRQWPADPLTIAEQYTPRDLTLDEIAHFEIVDLQ